jgi:hypothetical protein
MRPWVQTPVLQKKKKKKPESTDVSKWWNQNLQVNEIHSSALFSWLLLAIQVVFGLGVQMCTMTAVSLQSHCVLRTVVLQGKLVVFSLLFTREEFIMLLFCTRWCIWCWYKGPAKFSLDSEDLDHQFDN